MTAAQLDEIFQRIETAIIGRASDGAIVSILYRLTPQQKRQIAETAVNAVERAQQGRL